MAEVLGAVASGISIVQLSGQIAKNIIKLKGIWDQVKDAPEDISTLMKDLETLNAVLYELEPQQIGVHTDLVATSHAFRQCLALCREGSRELNDLVENLSTQISSNNKFRKTRGSLKMVMKKEQIKRYKSKLKSAIALLSFSHQCYSRAIAQLQFELIYSTLSKSIGPAPSLTQLQPSTPAPGSILPGTSRSHHASQSNVGPTMGIGAGTTPTPIFGHPLVGSILTFQQSPPLRQAKAKRGFTTRSSDYGSLVYYREPVWLSCRAWQLCYLRSQVGWTWNLTLHNVIPNDSRQFTYARTGQLSALQNMIASGEASIFDRRESGSSLLSMASTFGQIDTCKWLLEQGAHTDHIRFGSILNEVLHYGGSMSFGMGLPMFEVVRLLQQKTEFDIFDCAESVKGLCAFYGRKEILCWMINLSLELGYEHTVDDFMRLALNLARNTNHNAAELVRVVLNYVPGHQALQAKDQDDITLVHRIAARLGGSFAYEHTKQEYCPRAWDEDFRIHYESVNKHLLPRQKWCSLLYAFDLSHADLHAVSLLETTPLTMGLRTLVGVWFGSTSKLPQVLSRFVEFWLSNLKTLGICLLTYGEKEKRLLMEGLLRREFYRHSSIEHRNLQGSRDHNYGLLRLIALEPNSEADKWKLWWSEPTDEFAGDFWAMLERPSPRIPGAWDDDEYF